MFTYTYIHTCARVRIIRVTAICKIIGNRATDFNGYLYQFTTRKIVENRCSIPNYFAIPSICLTQQFNIRQVGTHTYIHTYIHVRVYVRYVIYASHSNSTSVKSGR